MAAAHMNDRVHRWVQQRGWDRAVDQYQRFWRDQLRPAHEAVLTAAALVPGERVIDVACGTGMVTLPAARSVGPRGAVLATDIAQGMVDDTARRAAEWSLTNVAVERRDAEHLGPHEGFDVALCSLGLMYVPAPAVALAEMARVLRPGGRCVVAVWGERRNCGWAEIFPIVETRVASDVCPLFFGLGAPGALAGLARRTGFVGLDEHRIETELVYADAEEAIGAAFLGGPVALAHSRFDAATRESAYADYLASIEPCRRGRQYRVPGEFVVVAGTKPVADEPPTSNTSKQLLKEPTP